MCMLLLCTGFMVKGWFVAGFDLFGRSMIGMDPDLDAENSGINISDVSK